MFRSLCLERLRGLCLQAFGVSSLATGQPSCEALGWTCACSQKNWWKSQLFDLNHTYEAIISSLKWYNEEKVRGFVLTDCKCAKLNMQTEPPLEYREWDRLELPAPHIHSLLPWVSSFGVLCTETSLCHLSGCWFSPRVIQAAAKSPKHWNPDFSWNSHGLLLTSKKRSTEVLKLNPWLVLFAWRQGWLCQTAWDNTAWKRIKLCRVRAHC